MFIGELHVFSKRPNYPQLKHSVLKLFCQLPLLPSTVFGFCCDVRCSAIKASKNIVKMPLFADDIASAFSNLCSFRDEAPYDTEFVETVSAFSTDLVLAAALAQNVTFASSSLSFMQAIGAIRLCVW